MFQLAARAAQLAVVASLVACAFVGSAAGSESTAAAPSCVVSGPTWTHYDAHGGAHPRLDAMGPLYYVNLMGTTCARAKAALVKIFPRMHRPPYRPVTRLLGAPAGFTCRSAGGGPPDISFAGLCANIATHQLFSWAPYERR